MPESAGPETAAPETIIITGASDGIGGAVARALSASGRTVVIVGRSPEKTAKVADALGADRFVADFARLSGVRRLAEQLLERYPRIDVLANNAGGIFGDRTVTEDGHELTFQVNHLAPFLLTNLLMDRLAASRARVINTSSVANLSGRIDINDLDLAKGFTPGRAYGIAKLDNILFTSELARRFGDRGITTRVVPPGRGRLQLRHRIDQPPALGVSRRAQSRADLAGEGRRYPGLARDDHTRRRLGVGGVLHQTQTRSHQPAGG